MLLDKLAMSIENLPVDFEIIVFDDSADSTYYAWHNRFSKDKRFRIFSAAKNKGRSASRNFLMRQANGSHCVLLDGDMWVDSDFMHHYLDAIEEYPEMVLVGGIKYDQSAAGLRLKIGAEREAIAALDRQKQPYRAFTAANVAIPMAVAKNIQFDESIVTYGHEDTVFGLALKEQAIPIKHIDNPAIHLGLDDDETYLKKVEESLKTLAGLWFTNHLVKKHAAEIKLLRIWQRCRWLLFIVPSSKLLLNYFRKKAKESVFWLDGYKLLYFQLLIKQQNRPS